MKNKKLKTVRLTGQDIRHLLEILFPHDDGRWDAKTNKWTYPKTICGKLSRALLKH